MLLCLPVELLCCIAEHLDDAKHINAFAQTNTHLFHFVNPYLYRRDVQHYGEFGVGVGRKTWKSVNNAKVTMSRSLCSRSIEIEISIDDDVGRRGLAR
jgi:hypothetical protein